MKEKVKILIDLQGQDDGNENAALVITPNKKFIENSCEELSYLNLAALFDICFENVVKILNTCFAINDIEVFTRIQEIEKSLGVQIK